MDGDRYEGGDGASVDMAPAYGRVAMLVFALITLVGLGARISSYLGGRSLFLDEAALALKICDQSYGELSRAHETSIVAPLGFLALEKACVDLLGPSNLAFRLIPFLAGIATLPVFWALCRTSLGPAAGAPGVASLAVVSSLIYHGAELKQYSCDAFFTALVLLAAARAIARPGSPARLATLAVVGLIAPWFSHPVIFALAAVATESIYRALKTGRPGLPAVQAGIGLAWALSFFVSYGLSKSMIDPAYPFDDHWSYAFLNFPPRSAGDISNYVATFLGFFEVIHTSYTTAPFNGLRLSVACAVAWSFGILAMFGRDRRPMLRVVLLILGYAVLSAALHRYPLRGRLVVFSVVPTLFLITAGLDRLMRSPARDARAVGWALFLGINLLPTYACLGEIVERPTRQEVESVLREVARRWRPGDGLYIHPEADSIYRFYAKYHHILDGVAPDDLILGVLPKDPLDASAYASEMRPLLGRDRVWVVISNYEGEKQLTDRNKIQLGALDRLGDRTEEIPGKRAADAYLYNFAASRRPSPGPLLGAGPPDGSASGEVPPGRGLAVERDRR